MSEGDGYFEEYLRKIDRAKKYSKFMKKEIMIKKVSIFKLFRSI